MKKRPIYHLFLNRLKEPRRFIQALIGPRQVGKTTLALQVTEALSYPVHYASADDASLNYAIWLEQQWEIARMNSRQSQSDSLLILDEVQKIAEWSSLVKRLWDEDTRAKRAVKVVLLGSAPLLIQQGLTESLAGRFEVIPVRHWSFKEMKTIFGLTLEQYIYFGGYPGAVELIHDVNRWKRYVMDSLIETTVSKDILMLEKIQKPILLKQLFHLGCSYSGQILSYQKMTGQLQDAGNTTTLAHYLDLLSGAGLLSGLSKYAGQVVRQRGSSPKFQVQNTALFSAISPYDFQSGQKDREYWGRLVESAIGAYLINDTIGKNIQVYYWREGNKEVDFVLQQDDTVIAIEVKSGKTKQTLSGMAFFKNQFQPKKVVLVGDQGISIERFLMTPVEEWFF